MKRNVLSFFKSSACARSFFVFGAAFLAILSISCKQLASFDPVVNGEQVVVGGGNSGGDTSSLEAAEFSFNLKATHGLMRKISLEWTAFSGAKYYEIYFAESASAEFTKIAETEQPFFDDAVAAGRTGYFKVCAVKANGASTPFSSTVVGTSLAVPIIGGGEVGDSKASISWFMENARGIDGTDYYEKTLKFEVVCQPKGESEGGETKVLSASSFSSTSYSYTFEELSSSKDYEFYVEAYLDSDTQSREKSPTVDKTTLTTYMPLAPKFSASEGDSAKGISLLITLPDMVTVSAFLKDSETPNIKQDVLFPLCFEVSRKHEKEEAYVKKATLYYDGTNLTTNPVEYQEGGAPYEVGAQVTWFDGDASLIGGQKYDYEIVSVPDINYSKVVCPEDKMFDNSENRRTPKEKTTTAQGWKSAPPAFNVKVAEDGGRKLSDDKSKVVSVSFGFSAEWNDLGKAGDYKFAIKQTYTPFTSESGTSAWLKNGETIYFDTLDGIKALVKTFGSDSGLPKNEQGTYSYTLYVVSKNDNGTSDIENNENVLDSANAIDRMVVTEDVSLPKAELAVQGGYKDKVHFKILTCEPNVKYRLERTKIVDGKPTDEIKDIQLDNIPSSGPFEGYDTTVQGNCSYSYVLRAVAASGVPAYSAAQPAETLGTPKVSFVIDEKGLPYDSVTVSFDGVLAAKNYAVTLGANGGFGGGKTYSFAAGFDGTSGDMKVSLAGKTYTVTINKPEGYNNARLAGNFVDAVVTAKSDAPGEAGEAKSDGVSVNVLGPALLNAQVNTFDETKEDSISLTWNAVDGAKGYLIKRVMYADAAMTSVADESGITYYCDASGTVSLADDDGDLSGRFEISKDNGKFKFTDKHKDTDSETNAYEKAQAKIAWGLPFRYVVLPVSKADDFDFDDLKLDGGEVAYTNLAPTEGTATFGYGLNLVADKATSGTHQTIAWNVPNQLKETQTAIYRRMYTTDGRRDNEFVRVTNFSSNDTGTGATILVENENLCNAFEYIVKYYEKYVTPVPDIKLPDSLFKELAKQTEEPRMTSKGEKIEQKNKGYLLAVDFNTKPHPNPSSQQKYTYADQISWTSWDYNIRAVGPETMELTMRNYNIDAEEHGVFLITTDKTTGKISVDLKKIDDDTDVEEDTFASAYNVISKDLVAEKGTASGMLKVLRDLPHYTLTLKNGEESVSYEKYTHRQITNEELVRAATLAMAIGMENSRPASGWGRTGSPKKTWNGTFGSVTTTWNDCAWEWGQGAHEFHTIDFNDIVVEMTCKSNTKVSSFLQINGDLHGIFVGSNTNSKPPQYYNGSVTVKNVITGEENIAIKFNEARKDSTDKIALTRKGVTTNFGNITPLPYNDYNGSDFFNNSAEWQ